jgi:hypothetical protein
LTYKEIAERIGVRPNTVSGWILKEGWEKLRKSMMVTRQKMISDLYDQLEWLNNHIITREITYDIPPHLLKSKLAKDKDDNPILVFPNYIPENYPVKIGNFATSKEANTIAVLTRSIKTLETETSIAEVYEVATGFLEYIKPQDFNLYKRLIPLFDAFINSKVE